MEGNYWWLTFRYTFIHLWKETIKSSLCVWSQNTGECNICDVSPGEATWSVVTGQWSLATPWWLHVTAPLVTLDKMRKILTFCVIWEIYLASSGNLFTKEHIVKQSRILNLLADLWRFITNYRWKPLELYSRVSCCGLCELELNLWTCPNWNMPGSVEHLSSSSFPEHPHTFLLIQTSREFRDTTWQIRRGSSWWE